MAMSPAPRVESTTAVPAARPSVPDIAGYIFLAFFALRTSISPAILNLVIPYSAVSGSAIYKIHIGAIGIIALALAYSVAILRHIKKPDRIVVWGIAIFVGTNAFIIAATLVLSIVAKAPTTSVGYLIDSLIGAALCAFLILGVSERISRWVPIIVVGYAMLNATVSLAEFVLHTHFLLLPFGGARFFRPAALSGHPLFTGVWCILGVMAVRYTKWPQLIQLGIQVILLGAVTSAGARLATVVCGVCFALTLIMPPDGSRVFTNNRMRQIYFGLLAALGLSPIAIAVARGLGFLARFDTLGVYDQSAATRVNVYQIFGMMTPQQLMFGMPIETAQHLILVRGNITIIESSFVIYVLQFGMIGAVLILASFAFCLFCLGTRSYRTGLILIFAFAVSCGGTIVLSLKGGEITALLAILAAARQSPLPPASRVRVRRVRRPSTDANSGRNLDLGSASHGGELS